MFYAKTFAKMLQNISAGSYTSKTFLKMLCKCILRVTTLLQIMLYGVVLKFVQRVFDVDILLESRSGGVHGVRVSCGSSYSLRLCSLAVGCHRYTPGPLVLNAYSYRHGHGLGQPMGWFGLGPKFLPRPR